jgi:hypothetical protein
MFSFLGLSVLIVTVVKPALLNDCLSSSLIVSLMSLMTSNWLIHPQERRSPQSKRI